ncbi:MAG: hypothetical protein OSA99_05125 [Acidimicrobiales bacterium]|nr:hypothetical protein [Acidimicrobiales bacterium]
MNPPHRPDGLADTRVDVAGQLDQAVELAFSVSYTCANVVGSVDGDSARRLEAGINQLDELIQVLRAVALSHDDRGTNPAEGNGAYPWSRSGPVSEAAHVLAGAERTVSSLWAEAVSANGSQPASVRDCLTDAARLVRRAQAALDETNLR